MAHDLIVPVKITEPSDVSRLIRELQAVDELFAAAKLRNKQPHPPKLSGLLTAFASENKLNLEDDAERTRGIKFLESVKDDAPVLNFSFSVDPSAIFLEKLVTWLRAEIDPLVLVSVGLQPNIGAGCVVRSRNKQFDLSLKQSFAARHDELMGALKTQAPVEKAVA